ncbi:MAG TPA: ABC transporter ATP-binding protein, partial [Rhodospirillaceae bacterium]|nr:ABC transporter ATP-binding protein [Rhodospirillaceae bacterium]
RLAQAILHDPEVLIMDEPTDGLDPNQKHQVRTLIKDMAHNKAIVISTHILEEVEAICTRAVVIAHGKLLADGTPEQLLRRDARHNAVVIKLAAGQAADIVAGLAALDQVAGVDALGDPVGGTAAFRARPKAGASIVLPVGDLLRSRNVTPEEMYVERGHMDEVFRKITQGDAQGGADA